MLLAVGKAKGEKDSAAPRASPVFGLQYVTLDLGVEEPDDQAFQAIRDMRSTYPQWFKPEWNHVAYVKLCLRPDSKPAQVGQPWLMDNNYKATWKQLCEGLSTSKSLIVLHYWNPKWLAVKHVNAWLRLLQSKIHANK